MSSGVAMVGAGLALLLRLLGAVHLSDDNYSEFLLASTTPLFVVFHAHWCPHCKEFMDVWNRVESTADFAERVRFADVECEESRRTCRERKTFPSLEWVEGNDTVIFNWDREEVSIVKFVWKQLNGTVQSVGSLEEARALATTEVGGFPTFIAGEGAAVLVRELARGVRDAPNQFYTVPGGRFFAAVGALGEVQHSGGWAADALLRFFWRNAFPFLGPPSGLILRQLEASGQRAIVRITAVVAPIDEAEEAMLRIVAEQFPVLAVACNTTQALCRRFGVRFDTRDRWYIVFSAKDDVFWATTGTINMGWLEQVKNAGVRPRGPGAWPRWAAPFVEAWLDHEAHGRPAWLIMAGPIVLLAVLAVVTIVCLRHQRAAEADADKKAE